MGLLGVHPRFRSEQARVPKYALMLGVWAPEAHLVEDDSGIFHGIGYPNQ